MFLKGKASLPLLPLGDPKPVGEQLVLMAGRSSTPPWRGGDGPNWPLSLLYFAPLQFEIDFQE